MTWRRSKAVSSTADQYASPTLQCVFARRETHLVLVLLMQIHAALLCFPPSFGHSIVDVGLVDDLGYELRAVIDSWRIGGRDLCAVDGVGGAVFDKKGKECENRTDQKDNYTGIDYKKDGEATSHRKGLLLPLSRGLLSQVRVMCR